MKKRKVVVFDFDGTLTRKDTFLEFIKFAKGRFTFYCGILMCSPVLLSYLVHLCPNDKAKQFVFSYFFKGMSYRDFKNKGVAFSEIIDTIVRPRMKDEINRLIKSEATIYVISASLTEWVAPWCSKNHIDKVLGTLPEVSCDGFLTGRFLTKNCYGQEKVNRLLEMEPNRFSYYLIAYGDSEGDKEILRFADEGNMI